MAYRMVLNNGVRVVGEEIPSMRSVSIGIWIATGSRNETAFNNGISHFLEHMMFKGTGRYSARELAQVFDGIGGQVNAFTSKEYTCYYAKVLDEHFPLAIDTLADMFFHSTFVPEEIEKEKKVILEEIRMYEDTPDELVMDLLAESVYQEHPLGYTILGTEDNLRSFTRNDVVDYVGERYRSNNVVISIAGNVSQGVAIQRIEKLFGHTFGSSPIAPMRMTPPSVFSRQPRIQDKDIEQVHICLATPGMPVGDARLYPLILLNNALGNTPSSRLFQEIREERGLAYTVFSFHSAYQDCGMFGVYAGTSPEHANEVIELIQEIHRDVAEHGLSEKELEQGKEQVKGSMMLSLESTSSRMSRLGKNELLLQREITLDETITAINRVTVDDVLRVAQEVLQPQPAFAAVGPVSALNLEKHF